MRVSLLPEKMKYAFSYSHMDDKAIMQMSDFKRDNANLKLSHKPIKNITIDLSADKTGTSNGSFREADFVGGSDGKTLDYP